MKKLLGYILTFMVALTSFLPKVHAEFPAEAVSESGRKVSGRISEAGTGAPVIGAVVKLGND
jgi:hypothetical protein